MHKPIGQWLIQEGVLTQQQLDEALNIQANSHMPLGDILLHHYYVPRLTFYQTLAKQLNRPFVNLLEEYHAEALFDVAKIDDYLQLGYVPINKNEHGIVYAVTSTDTMFALDGSDYKITSPLDIFYIVQQHGRAALTYKATDYLRDAHKKHALTYQSPLRHRMVCCSVLLCLVLVLSVILYSDIAFSIVILFCNIIFLLCLLFKLALSTKGIAASTHIETITHNMMGKLLSNDELPIYTVLVPLHMEERAAQGIIRSLERMDYPKEKLDIKLIIEEDDTITRHALLAAKPPAHFHIITVPVSFPRTKPKACNYALSFAKGAYIAIYDAEDMPDEQQLRLAATCFHYSDDNIAALQARLDYYNANENLLTQWFSFEYQLLFNILLPSMYQWNIPIPLGGTSNHIRYEALKTYGAWDAYNVTEDADLGLRLASAAYLTLPIASTTKEEAPLKLNAWIAQRSRWIKGYLQSWFVMMRSMKELQTARGIFPLIAIHIFMGLSSFCYMVAPFLWGSVMLQSAPFSWNILAYLCVFNVTFGALVHYTCLFIALRRQKVQSVSMVIAFITFPLYFILHSIASCKAVWQLMTKPYYWEKTTHGLSKFASLRLERHMRDS